MKNSGFTLVELIIVMIIIGVLAIAALPRFFDRNTFDARGFADGTQAMLGYAQKAAVAQRRNVCASFTANSVSLRVASATGNGAACDTDLAGPAGAAPYQLQAKGNIQFAALPADFSFNALGQASAASTIEIAGFSGKIRVEQETGYVYQGP
ncbi:MAG TPA: prepilin-type N-terminal cleavage/methylation domain-containing protein [Burkholderiaceae bacterium]|nr:prepilin-type N-terminal cleavage/methylation domain-containing protein [Burkholderiaceae bacterium]